jgi:Icc-related predicted phosphoesterase
VKIKILSDLHLSHHPDKGEEFLLCLENDADILLLAGDLTGGHSNLEYYLKQLCDIYDQVIYVLGNHEYYGHDKNETINLMAGLSISNLHWLENRRVNIKGQNFIGATLWYERRQLSKFFSKTWSDFRCIRGASRFVYEDFKQTKAYFANNIKENDIVITHCLPAAECCDPRFCGNAYNIFFFSDLQDLIQKTKPKLWVFGHTHTGTERKIWDTQVISNPYGYYGQNENSNFFDGVIEI